MQFQRQGLPRPTQIRTTIKIMERRIEPTRIPVTTGDFQRPITLATPHTAPAGPVHASLLSGTAIDAITVNEPKQIPPPARSTNAQPTIDAVSSRASPKQDI
ncbi:hypothetical protein BPAE_0141g00050 [Botrytis paeoniae]|uniref:Uncharacterized protein n=1 Tax=Botrytis paeoniae TaxID=278948 RepID=A0A4Z1FFK4_9HELO|nr:hypothetical protein BPAE_0141g00050 [Botrytis paeoniae]